jgi:taurine dioxygenase
MKSHARRFKVVPLGSCIGAEISGINLANPLNGDEIDLIRQSLTDHLVVFFRDQDLQPGTLLGLAKQFGTPVPYPFVEGMQNYPEVVEVLKLPKETQNFGGVWHSDTAYLAEPAMGALLYAETVPARGGDTLFASMYAAYERLSPGMKAFLGRLSATNDADKPDIAATRVDRQTTGRKGLSKGLSAEHPVIRTHPVTARPLIYVNRAHTTRFVGMTEAESKPLLNYLFDLQTQPEFTCRFHWGFGSLAFWDNRACQHYPLNDYHGELRRMYRVSLKGDKPF